DLFGNGVVPNGVLGVSMRALLPLRNRRRRRKDQLRIRFLEPLDDRSQILLVRVEFGLSRMLRIGRGGSTLRMDPLQIVQAKVEVDHVPSTAIDRQPSIDFGDAEGRARAVLCLAV